jgi:hypothetical protein
MTNKRGVKYLADTNVLIGFSLWKPIALPNLNLIFWNKLSEALEKDKWTLLDVVVDEILYDKDLKKWCTEQKNKGLLKKISDDDKNRAVEINNRYKMIDAATANSTVDTYLIAYAEANGVGIFSRESPGNGGLYKIPDVCNIFKIDNTKSPKLFLRGIDFD